MPEQTRDWYKRYADGDTPWDSGQPSRELQRILEEGWIKPCRVLELGCGTGTNAVFLAQQGFDVMAFELVPSALEVARKRAERAGVRVHFLQADFFQLPDLGQPFPFVFDRGVYHVLRSLNVERFREVLGTLTHPGSLYLTLTGNANEVDPAEGGPPRVHAHEISLELGPLFDVVQLREFRFDGVCVEGREIRPLAWSALLRRRVKTS